MRLAALVLSLAFAAPLSAQDLPFEPELIEACLEDDGGRDCIGLAASRCAATPDGRSTVGTGFCYGAERDWWDARLNRLYRSLMTQEEGRDAEMKEIGATVMEIAPALRDMQRAWMLFRDAACMYEYSQWGGGTGAGPAHAACMMQITAEQALALEDRLSTN